MLNIPTNQKEVKIMADRKSSGNFSDKDKAREAGKKGGSK